MHKIFLSAGIVLIVGSISLAFYLPDAPLEENDPGSSETAQDSTSLTGEDVHEHAQDRHAKEKPASPIDISVDKPDAAQGKFIDIAITASCSTDADLSVKTEYTDISDRTVVIDEHEQRTSARETVNRTVKVRNEGTLLITCEVMVAGTPVRRTMRVDLGTESKKSEKPNFTYVKNADGSVDKVYQGQQE